MTREVGKTPDRPQAWDCGYFLSGTEVFIPSKCQPLRLIVCQCPNSRKFPMVGGGGVGD